MTGHKQTISKADAANRQLAVAIRMYLNGGDMVAIHTLACAAREIYEKHCQKAGIKRFYDEIAATYPDSTQNQIFDILNSTRNFLKHPDSDGNLDAVIELSDRDNKLTLFVAAYDCACLLGEQTPVIVQAYNVWILATEPDLQGACTTEMETRYPGLVSGSAEEQKAIGLRFVEDALSGKFLGNEA
ncbi:hypothetical protein GTP46_05850 [Duganella sp. FT135W]|uniref:Uncharacterized protein n=1 Tax=Duganella flavida TaxID=2692175 RepID=A0A6L8K5F1_9BURK|nr:hypothetical protein [Duganella flavida]MYM22165.1 hypothetical protein [Duganella flavida]